MATATLRTQAAQALSVRSRPMLDRLICAIKSAPGALQTKHSPPAPGGCVAVLVANCNWYNEGYIRPCPVSNARIVSQRVPLAREKRNCLTPGELAGKLIATGRPRLIRSLVPGVATCVAASAG